MVKFKIFINLFTLCFLNIIAFSTIKAQNNCPVFIPKAATFVSSNKTAAVGNMSYVLDGEGNTGLQGSGAGNFSVYWLQSSNPVTFFFDMKTASTISRVKFYTPWGADEGVKNVTIRLYNDAILLGTEAIVIPPNYTSGYIANLSKSYTNVTKIQMVVIDDYNTSGATPKRTSLTEIVFGDTACDDTDNDNVYNYRDLDNDNDGIKDIDENCSGFLAQNTTGTWNGNTSSSLTATLTGATAQANIHTFLDQQIKFYINNSGGGPRFTKQNNINFTYTFSNPVPANEIAFFIDDLDAGTGGSSAASIRMRVNGGHPNGNFILTDYSATPYLTFNNIAGTITPTGNVDNQRLIIKGVGNLLVSSITFTSTGIGTTDNVAYALLANNPCNTDGDSLPNIYDLDSDNDGCPDAIEGDASFTSSNLVDSSMLGGNIATTSGTYNLPIIKNLGNTVGNNATNMGIPTIAAEGQLAGTSQSAGVQDAFCCIAPDQPTLSIVTHPTCSISTGSFTITNYNAAYTYTFTPSLGIVNTAGTVTAPVGNYTVTASLGNCSSLPSNLVINSTNCNVVCNSIVDDFNITQSIAPINTSVANDYSVVSGIGILGGERDVALINKTGTLPHNFNVDLGYGYIDYAQGAGQKSTLVLQWDGADNDASTLNPIGLGGISFNNVNSLDFHLTKDLTNTGLPITIELYTDAGNASSLTKIFNTGDNFDTSFKFSEFTPFLGLGVDLNNIGAVVLKIDPSLASGSGLDLQLNNFNFECSVIGSCYKPAQTVGITLDTNHGITALGRNNDNSNWPMVRKGAWTVLEAKTKGFVVNRLTDAQISAIPSNDGVQYYPRLSPNKY